MDNQLRETTCNGITNVHIYYNNYFNYNYFIQGIVYANLFEGDRVTPFCPYCGKCVGWVGRIFALVFGTRIHGCGRAG